jgi:hypothetical protein
MSDRFVRCLHGRAKDNHYRLRDKALATRCGHPVSRRHRQPIGRYPAAWVVDPACSSIHGVFAREIAQIRVNDVRFFVFLS